MTFKGSFTTSIPSTSTITHTITDIFFFFFDSHRNFSRKEKIRNNRSSHLYKFAHVCLQTVAKEIRKYSRLRNWRSFAQKRGNVEYSKGNFAGDFSARSASSPIVPGNSLTFSPYRFSSRAVNVNPGQLYYWVIIPGKPWGSTRAKKKRGRRKTRETLRGLENELQKRKRSREFTPPDQFCSSKSIGKRVVDRGRFFFLICNFLASSWKLRYSCLILLVILFYFIILFY